MTMKIEVTIPVEAIQGAGAAEYLTHAMSAIGFSRGFVREDMKVNLVVTGDDLRKSGEVVGDDSPLRRHAVAEEAACAADVREQLTAEGREAAERGELTAENVLTPKRERGKPAPGRARRTKEEIAEDEAADRRDADIAARVADDERHAKVMAAGEATLAADEAKANISTGEERIDPTTAEDAAQDAADEAAEVAATPAKVLSHDDVRAALNKYLKAFGLPATQEDGPKVLAMMFGAEKQPKDPANGWKVSDIPDTQDALARAIAGIEEMLAKNPFKREALL